MPYQVCHGTFSGKPTRVNDPNLIASIRQRLLNIAKSNGEVFDFVLSRYAIERLLFRLGQSQHADSFVLKGAMLFYLWNKSMHRPTRDVDFLGFGPADCESLEATFTEIAESPVPDDGLTFETSKIEAAPIREEAIYDGIRIRLPTKLGTIKIPLQIDIGFGDVITPSPDTSTLRSLIPELPAPIIKTYPIYTVVAEKLEAMVLLGEQNSRMKDFYDIHFLATTEEFDEKTLHQAIKATFNRRKTPIPNAVPESLTQGFATQKQTQWSAFHGIFI
jgi:predicted nucleotidyltransferase component of viral defense system